jgi:hypothetical protein
VIFVIGAQKIVSDVAAGMRRIYEYCYPLEDARARRAHGVPSGVNNILVINKVMTAAASRRSSSGKPRILTSSSCVRLHGPQLEADLLPDKDDVDAVRHLLMDLEDLPHLAVLPVRGLRACVLEPEAVLIDALVRRCQRGHEFLRADHEDDIGGAPGVGGELAARRRGVTRVPSRVTAWTLPSA